MQKCHVCTAENREGVVYCKECGTLLNKELSTVLNLLPVTTRISEAHAREVITHHRGTGEFDVSDELVLGVGEQEVTVEITEKVVLGRSGEKIGAAPVVDLTPVGAYREGVSRRHCEVMRVGNHLVVTDLGSGNGTFLNGERLVPGRAYPLCHRDLLWLGGLKMTVYFQPKTVPMTSG